nr:T9SS sorting signal type C domain-containing protein [uncultured Flavobacterium sp.]
MKRILLFAIFFITQLGYGQIIGDYRSTGNVTFAATTNWQIYNGTAWVSATMAPKDASYTTANTITVRSGHTATVSTTVTIAAKLVVLGIFTLNNGANLSIGPIVVDNNGTPFMVSSGSALTVNGNFTVTKGDMSIAGTIYIDGNFSTNTGNVDVTGTGSMATSGSMTTQGGGGSIFDSTAQCPSGPCSGTSLNCPSSISPPSQTICQNSQSGPITITLPAGATVVKWQSTTDFLIFTDISNTTTVLPAQMVSQTTRFRAVYRVSSGCSGDVNSPYATVAVNPAPTTAAAGPDQSGNSPSYTLSANTPTVGTGAWSIISGPNTSLTQFSSTSNPLATFTPSPSGTYVLAWTISNGSCTSSDQVVISGCVNNLITNGNFTNAGTGNNLAVGWTFRPGNYVETYPENTYFSTGNPGYVAELDSQASLRQAVTVVPGVSYTLNFIYARRNGPEAPSPSGVTIAVIGGTSVASQSVFSTPSSTPQIGTFTFTPMSASITLDFYNHLATNQTYGTIIDNIVLVPSSQVTPLATTSPKGVFNTLASCAGSPVQLDVENVPSSGVTYFWTGSAGATFSATNIRNPIVTFTGSGLKEATVSVTTSGGCISSSTTYVNLDNTNAPTITTAATPAVVSAVCQSAGAQTTSMAYTATTNLTTSSSYRIDWNTLADQGTTAFTTGGSLTGIVVPAGTPAGTYTGTLIVTNASCSATRAITMTINPLPSAPTIGTIMQPTCALATGSIALSGLPSSGSWSITATPATSGLTGWTGTNVDNTTIGGLTANTSYTFVVNYGPCSSTASTAAVINAIPATATWNGSAWSGTTPAGSNPLLTQPIVFTGNYTSSGDINGCSCTVTSGNVLIKDGHTMTITNAVNVTNNATTSLVFESNASLVQTTNVTNTGAIEYRRISAPMKNFDYTYWSSPVHGDDKVTPVIPKQTAKNLSPNTLWDKYFRYDPTSATGWVFDDGEMTPGVGFIIRVPKPNFWPVPTASSWSQPVAFKGIPNNGNYFFDAGANELNLIGNPYPSAIDADLFITNPNNATMINGALYFWTHNTAITNNEYAADDYASYTLTGGTGTGGVGNFAPEVWVDANNNLVVESGEYVDLNENGVLDKGLEWIDSNNDNIRDVGEWTDSNNNGKVDLAPVEMISNRPLGKIAAGQSFFVGTASGIPANSRFQFKNSMRIIDQNTQFFKQASTKKATAIEKNRVWLNLTNSKGAFKQLLVGYITGATNDWDNMYDGPTFDGQEFVDFYSVNKGQNLTIQGRALPFVDTDVVPLGYRSTIAGSFDISIDNRDGSLAGQAIWLEDKKTNTLHELSKGKYTFTAINGVENDRFVLKYTGKTLGTDDNEVADKSLIVSVKNKKITLTSSAEAITQVQLFDLLGRKVYDKSKINAQEWSISNLPSSEQTLIVKTTLANGAVSNKKIVY